MEQKDLSSCSEQESVISPKSPYFFWWTMVFRNQNLTWNAADCSWYLTVNGVRKYMHEYKYRYKYTYRYKYAY